MKTEIKKILVVLAATMLVTTGIFADGEPPSGGGVVVQKQCQSHLVTVGGSTSGGCEYLNCTGYEIDMKKCDGIFVSFCTENSEIVPVTRVTGTCYTDPGTHLCGCYGSGTTINVTVVRC